MKTQKKLSILVIHGPNLNLLGEREPEIYGSMTLAQINSGLRKAAKQKQINIKIFQSNSEGKIIDLIHQYRKWANGMVINPGAYTHYSYAIRDAVSAVQVPTVEVHLSDIFSREEFRRVSVIAPVCRHQISGQGWKGYVEAINLLKDQYGR